MDRLRNFTAIVAVMCAISCSRQDRDLEQHQETLASLSSSTAAIVDAWLHGSVSGTFTLSALEQMLALVEQDRASLTASPKLLIDQRGAALADSAAQMSVRIASIMSAVQDADAHRAREQVAAIPFHKAS